MGARIPLPSGERWGRRLRSRTMTGHPDDNRTRGKDPTMAQQQTQQTQQKDKAVLAYSGGLDTSVCIKWLQEEKNLDVIAVVGDVGQEHVGLE